jgi:hypothetical protein
VRALTQHRDPVADLDGLVEVVGDEDDGLAQLALEADQLVLEVVSGDGVDGAERLVHQQHRRVGGQGARHPDPLLLAAGELARVAAVELGRLQAHQVEHLLHPVPHPRLGPAEHPGHQRDVLRDGHVREEAGRLDGIADLAAQLDRVHPGDVLLADADTAGGGLDQPVDHLEEGGLAAAGGADEDHRLPGLDLHAHVVHGGSGGARIALGEPLQLDGGAGGLRHGSPWRWSAAR